LRGRNNVQGASDIGAAPDVFPGYQHVTDPEILERFEKGWGVRLPPMRGLDNHQMVDAIYAGKLRAMYLAVEDMIAALRQAKREKQAQGIRAYQPKRHSTERRDPGRGSQPHVAEVLYRTRITRTDLAYHPILKLPCLPIPRDDNNRNDASRERN
jgi:hypothetical protein